MVRSDSAEAVGSIGTGFIRPPSASNRPFMSTGVMTPGIATEARTAESNGPRWNQTSRRARRSVATAVNDIGRSSISCWPISSSTSAKIRLAAIAPPADHFGSSSRRISRCLRLRTHSVNSARPPAAYSPPIKAPIEEPATATTSCPRDSISAMAPMWA